ncbi:hypothetical protein T4B_7410 [Trichinella pseudospiralis]|uniref:Uncharacterized protein n=1 Tax=Trichinella pseudospiralis TaxID=6337 RepID=A0A0V1GBF1_TRIPS|nr:hypothetical protein T4B_7410 [Trichinella pseudospiralis]
MRMRHCCPPSVCTCLECGYLLKIFDSVFLNYVWMCSVQNSSELTVYENLIRLSCKK